MVSSDEIKRRLEAKRRGIEYEEPVGRRFTNNKECPTCHTENPSTAKFCVGCGMKLETPQPERSYAPDIKGPQSEIEEEKSEVIAEQATSENSKITPRPDDFGRTNQQKVKSTDSNSSQPPTPEPTATEKLEPIVPKTPEEKPEKSEPATPQVPEPPHVKTVKPKPEVTKPESDVDPVERIKKAKELLDIGAITQEEFEMIKNRYLKLL